MVDPMTPLEQISSEIFEPDVRMAVQYSALRFDAVFKYEKQMVVKQVYDDLPENEDGISMEEVFKRYNFTDFGTNDELRLNQDNNPTIKQVNAAKKHIMERLRAEPEKKFAIFYAVDGHGIVNSGKQTVLINY